MKTRPVVLLVLICISCGSDKPDMTKTAATGIATPLYDGMVDATTGSSTRKLPPQTLVYVQNFELDVNNRKMVKVYVNETIEGYVRKDWLLEDGKLGVVDASEENPVVIFDDEEGQVISGKTIKDLQIVSFKNISAEASQIFYANERDTTRPFLGYVRAPVASDSLSLAFANAYIQASRMQEIENNPAPMEALLADPAYESLSLRQSMFGSANGASLAGDNHTEMKWINEDGKELTGDEIPGEVVLHYIWDDKTESDGNHFGDNLEQGTPDCGENKSAFGYKLLFTPNKKFESVFLVCTLPSIADTEGPRQMEFKDVEPGTTYALEVLPNVYGVICDEPTTFTVQTNLAHHGEAVVHASCGD